MDRASYPGVKSTHPLPNSTFAYLRHSMRTWAYWLFDKLIILCSLGAKEKGIIILEHLDFADCNLRKWNWALRQGALHLVLIMNWA
jgi:hypothetical protein